MNKLKAGEVYKAVSMKEGRSRMGDWELLLTMDKNGRNEIAIFVQNIPSTIRKGDTFRIDRIQSVCSGFRKREGDDKWVTATIIDADCTLVERAPYKHEEV